MRFEFKLPDLAEGMVEGEIVNWLVSTGDTVQQEQPVVEVMTDKATVVISSPVNGTVLELAYAAGDIADVGTVLFVLDTAGEGSEAASALPGKEASAGASANQSAPPPSQESASEARPKATSAPPKKEPTKASPVNVASPSGPVPAPVARGAGKALATPATRRLARELGVDIGEVQGTGPAGRVTKEDLQRHAQGASPTPQPSRPAPSAQTPAASATPRLVTGEELEERERIRGLRRAIHDAMARSKHTAAHFTYVEEIECTNLIAARDRLKPAAAAQGVRMTFLPFIAKATLLALRYFPKMNASVDDEAGEVIIKRYFHLGVAAATSGGLVVPVIKHADKLTLLELATAVGDLGERARNNSLSPEELRGSTFTITSLGRIGGLFATPIINPPEVGILGVHKMEPRAVIRDGQVVARSMMNLSLSFDHRLIDGHEGAEFAQRIKRYLEDPDLMMLEMA